MRRMHSVALSLLLVSLVGCGGGGGGGGGMPDAGGLGPDGASFPVSDAMLQPTVHAEDITANETWARAGSPHLVDGCISLGWSSTEVVTLTIEAGVEVRFTAGSCLIVGDTDRPSALVAHGNADEPIVFTSNQAAGARTPGYWDGIIFGQETDGSTLLDHVAVEFGGRAGTGAHSGPNWADAMILAWGNSDALPALSFKHTTVRYSSTDGIVLAAGARFASDSEALVVSDNEGYPIHIEAGSAHTLPTDQDSGYGGNGQDAIYLLDGNGYELASGALDWNQPGVPYLISNNVWVTGADWTIAAGVTVAAVAGGEIEVSGGTLTADGVTFTSWPETTYWGGIYFDPPGTGVLRNCVVERGGAVIGGNSAGYNVYVEAGAVTPPTIADCSIRSSLHDGIATWDLSPATYQANSFGGNVGWDIFDYNNEQGWNQP